MEELWSDAGPRRTIYGSILPLLEGTGDLTPPRILEPAPGLGLVAGDLLLSAAEDELSTQWPDCLDEKPRAFRVVTALSRALRQAAPTVDAQLTLVDVGPNLGSVNRAALLSADHVLVPLAPDLYSIQGLRNLGPTLRTWRKQWNERRRKNPVPDLDLPQGQMSAIGYVVLQHAVRLDRPVRAYERWMNRIPGAYREYVLEEAVDRSVRVTSDPHCRAMLKHFRSLMPLAQEARKPMFLLRAADGALGGHAEAVRGCHRAFRGLAREVARVAGIRGLDA